MSTTLTASRVRSKPAESPATPSPDTGSKAVLIHPLVNAIARSKMMSAVRAIHAAAEALLEQLEEFDQEFSSNSILAEVRAAGIENGNCEYLRTTATHFLHDVRGFRWPVETFVMCISSELLDEDAGDLSDIAAKSR